MSKRGRTWLIAGVAVLLLLITISIPKYQAVMVHSKENILAVNLRSMRGVIKQYREDKKKAPQSLQDLVDSGYYRELPVDPFTNSTATWQPVMDQGKGITDVHSASSSVSSKGTTYSAW
jgi:general secretion pathway protein G